LHDLINIKGEDYSFPFNGEQKWCGAQVIAEFRCQGVCAAKAVLYGQDQRLLAAQKMEELGRLAGGVAHDFNNLLTVVSGATYLLQMELPRDSPLHQEAEQILLAAKHGSELTHKLLSFSREKLPQERVVHVNHVLFDMQNLLRSLLDENIELTVLPGEHLPPVSADPSQLSQILVNLAVNARDAMPDGGKLMIATTRATLSGADAGGVGAQVSGPCVRITVRDTGCGMDPEVREHIFERFFSTKTELRGTGLGLTTVLELVEQCHGRVDVESAPDRGTTFRIHLPALPGPVQDGGEETDDTSQDGGTGASSGTETVLVVEDDSVIRRLVARYLKSLGYQVLTAGNGDEAVHVAAAQGGPIDLLLTDVVLPLKGGVEVAAELKANMPGIKVVFMSGYTTSATGKMADCDSHCWFLPKPFRLPTLGQSVRAALDGKRQADDGVDAW